MNTVLVAYASKHGSTAEIAEAIADALRAGGLQADCVEAGDVASLEPYDAVVLGSAVYMRRWRRAARRFLSRHAAELEQRPFWVFSSGPVGDPANDDPKWTEPAKTIATAKRLGVRDHVVFGGKASTGAMERATPPEYRDRRDWDAIRAWANGIVAQLRVPARI
ncbi:MAG TPA: flavodoxin domain-containing protein [Solirubrobacter sp.]|nr:flavodoxin domain-containing protein [Solirubrobacter sp.]